MNPIKLTDLVDAIECYTEEHHILIDRTKNEVCIISDEAISLVKNEDNDYPEWQEEEVQWAKAYLNDESNFIALPSQRDANEYSMMEDFVLTLDNESQKEKFSIVLHGKRAFRRFKDMAIHLDIVDDWYLFRDERYKEFILDWCESKGIQVNS